MRRRMTQIANAARKLLRHLGVWKLAQAPDGPGIAVLQVLASTDDGTEDAIVRATARIGRLVEILEAADAARELERRARMGAEDVVRIGKD
jgi:Flp pilus assembly CpaE family ATPase